MDSTPPASSSTDRWFAEWFNDEYLKVYSHRDEDEARSISALIRARVPSSASGLALDLGCGAGRHLPYLSRRRPAVGLDLSPWLLGVAKRKNPGSPLVRADMRNLPFRDESFTLVVNLFTSFGYFIDDAQNEEVLREVARVTAPGGWLVLDFLNASHVRQNVVPFDRRQVGSLCVQQRREISESGRFIRKAIRLGPQGRVFTERVRLFEPGDLIQMLTRNGFQVAETFGDYRANPLTNDSPRAIILARRNQTTTAREWGQT